MANNSNNPDAMTGPVELSDETLDQVATEMPISGAKRTSTIEKRGQMFDMLRQIIDKYNKTAKNMIQGIGR